MRTLTIKNIPDELYDQLKRYAEMNRRSLNSEVIMLIERAFGSQKYSPEIALERARLLREKTKGYNLGDQEMTEAKVAGRP